MRSIIGWSLLGIPLPGLNYIGAGWKKTGSIILTLYILLMGAGAFLAFSVPIKKTALRLASDSQALYLGTYILPAISLIWAIQFLIAFILLYRKNALPTWKRAIALIIATLTTLALLAPGALGGYYSYTTYNTLKNVFSDADNDTSTEKPDTSPKLTSNPWADTTRVNLLLLGGDEGRGRIGVRPDIIMVASINTQTGRTELFNIPRNLRHVKFPSGTPGAKAFPQGFTFEEGLINSVWQWGDEHKELFPQEKSAGITATQQAVEGAMGINIDYRAYINMKGFEDFIDAIGGVTVNVPRDLPKAKEGVPVKDWVRKGKNQKLKGNDALWFVRSRAGSSDYDRMERTRCMIKDITTQTNAQSLASKFPELMKVLKDNFSMNIPQKDISAWADLFERVQQGGLDGVALTNDVITPYNPDYAKLHALVKKSIGESDKEAEDPKTHLKPDVGVPYAIPDYGTPSPTPTPSPTKTAKKKTAVDDKTDEYC